MNVEVKPGYKLTEVGVIPEDWEVMTLGTVSEMSSGTTPSRTLMDRYYKNGSIAWVKTLDLNNSDICETDECVTDLALKETCLRVNPIGTVLVAMYGGFNQIGRTGLLRLPAAVNQAITAIHPFKGVLLSDYLIRNINYRIEYWKRVASSSRKDPNITSKDIRDFPVAYPKLQEQEAIAEALSDADALIESLEQLITKKRQIKQGAMQELLTGKKRLPGFSGEWEVKKLGDVSEMGSGGTPASSFPDYYDGDIPWVSISDMTKGGKVIQSTDRNLSGLGFANSAAQMFPAGTVLYAMYASLGECSIAGISLCSSQAILGIRPKETLESEFLYYFLTSLKTIVKSMGQQGTQSNLNKAMVQAFQINLPTFSEQTAIAKVLSDMDNEIDMLEIKLEKILQLKQGMMHNLLTGKIRIV